MRYPVLFFVLLLSFPLLAGPALSAPLENIFSDSRLVYSSAQEQQRYAVALGTLKKINSEWVTEKEVLVDGFVTRRTYELASSFRSIDGLSAISTAVKGHKNRLIFACDGLGCGSSTIWANQRFGIKLLSGTDQTQSYRVWEISVGEDRYLLASYTVMRANRRVYSHLERIKLSQPVVSKALVSSPKAILTRLQDYGFFVMDAPKLDASAGENADANIKFEANQLNALVEALILEPFLRFTIVGHDYSVGADRSEQLDRARAYAQALHDVLIERGVKARRMSVTSVGALAPANEGSRAKVVLLKD